MVSAYRPITVQQRFVEVREREDDPASRLICLIDFSVGVLITYYRGEKRVVLLNDAYRRWQERYEPSCLVDNDQVLTG